jgi:DNA-directed RNA polymerase subunit alpha
MDSIFTPVKKVRFDVEATRVSQMTNLDKLVLEIETDGSVTPDDALKFSSNILQSYFNLFNQENIMVEAEYMSDFQKISQKQVSKPPSCLSLLEIGKKAVRIKRQ